MWWSLQSTRLLGHGKRTLSSAILATGLALFATSTGCKEPPKPKAKPDPTQPFNPGNTSFQPSYPTPEPVDPRCHQTTEWACNVPQDLKDLCAKLETDTAPCLETVWSKTLFDKILKAQTDGFDGSMKPCPANNYFVSTQNDPLNIRNRPGVDGDILGTAPRGSSVQCLGIVDTWIKAKTSSGVEGYLSNAYLSTVAPGPAVSGSGSSSSAASSKGTIRCSRWVRLEAKETFTARAFTKCQDRETQDGRGIMIWNKERRFENCYKIGQNPLGLHECECEAQYEREIADKTINECVGEWRPYN